MCYNQTGDISTLDGTSLKLVDKFTNLGSSVSSTEKDIDTRLMKAWTAIDRLSIIWKSDLTDKMKRSFFQAAVVLILLYGCTTWTLTKRPKKKLDGNYTRMLRAILNKSWRQHPTSHQLYGHLPPITKTIQVRRIRHAGHCWRSNDELISDVLQWTPAYVQAKEGRPAQTYIQQLCEDTGCSPEDLPEAMNDREKWRERVRDIRASGTTWWWWWWEGDKAQTTSSGIWTWLADAIFCNGNHYATRVCIAVATSFGLYGFKGMPFGLHNARLSLQYYKSIRELPFTFAYINDILIVSRNMQEYYERLHQVFKRPKMLQTKNKCL